MKRNFAVSLFGSFIGFGMFVIVLNATSVVGARGSDTIGSDVPLVKAVVASSIVTSTFTYQGQLINNGSPVNNTCNFQFGLYDALSAGNRLGLTQTVSSVTVQRGLFTALLNTGNQFGETAFIGEARWLQIAVACPAGGGYTSLSPRQPLTSLPFALPGLRTFPNATSPNIVGGFSGNSIISNAVGSIIGGGGKTNFPNIITNSYAFIGGGYDNIARGSAAAIGGGNGNQANATYATVGGGISNQANGFGATIGGGISNRANGDRATVGGGDSNFAIENNATVGGGSGNLATGLDATVGGGSQNNAGGYGSAIPGGQNNSAIMTDTFAAGHKAQALHQGAFVWGDSTNVYIASTKSDQFVIRASNGVSLSVNAGESKSIDVGERYRDNALIAWADIAGNGTLSGEFGVTSVSHSTGIYTITLDATAVDAFRLVPIATVEVDAPPTSAASARLVTINIVDAHTFIVYVTNGSYALVDNQILFMATAR
jgi:hypothetical protein